MPPSPAANILNLIKRGDTNLPPRVILSGPIGIGKTDWGSSAPSPLFVCAEDGLTGYDHVQRLTPTNFQQVKDLVDAMIVDPMGYKTLVFDTADWLERLLQVHVCTRDGQKDGIEGYGYGRGYVAVEEELVGFLQSLDTLRSKQQMIIIFLCHVQITTFTDPRGEKWDRYSLKGHKKFSGVLSEWVDACLFAVFDIFKTKDKSTRTEKTIGGDRVIHTRWDPAWEAKNRLNLPEEIQMPHGAGWAEFESIVKAGSVATARTNAAALLASAKQISEADKPKWEKWASSLGNRSLVEINAGIEKLKKLQ